MRQRNYGRDSGLTLRITFTMMMLAGLWVVFMGLLFWAGIPWPFILVLALVGAALQYYTSDKLVLMSTRARVVTAQEEPKLHATIERLAHMADMPVPKKIAVMETHVPNAFATGRNPKNAVVAVSRGLMTRLTDPEIEAVLGHELIHVKNRDVAVMTWAYRDDGRLPAPDNVLDEPVRRVWGARPTTGRRQHVYGHDRRVHRHLGRLLPRADTTASTRLIGEAPC